ncbi:MAG: Histidine kinase [Chloroflexi bacterium]|nr:Histidine kinase [Chloroflexota bacterium]
MRTEVADLVAALEQPADTLVRRGLSMDGVVGCGLSLVEMQTAKVSPIASGWVSDIAAFADATGSGDPTLDASETDPLRTGETSAFSLLVARSIEAVEASAAELIDQGSHEFGDLLNRSARWGVVGFPVGSGDEFRAVMLFVQRRKPTHDEISVMGSFVSEAERTVERGIRNVGRRAPYRARNELAMVQEMAGLNVSPVGLDLDALLQVVAERTRTTLSADIAAVMLPDEVTGALSMCARSQSEIWGTLSWESGWTGGVSDHVMRTGRSVLVVDTREDERLTLRDERHGESVVAAPMMIHGKPIGVLRIGTLDVGRFGESALRLVESLAQQTAILVENARLYRRTLEQNRELEARNRDLNALNEISQAILGSLDLETVVQSVLDRALSVTGLDFGEVHLLGDEGKFQPIATKGMWHPERMGQNVEGDWSKSADARQQASGEPIIIEDLAASGRLRFFRPENAVSSILLPVRAGDTALGVMNLVSRTPHKFTPSEVQLLMAMASQAGIAIQKARLYTGTVQAYADLQRSEEDRARLAAIIEGAPYAVSVVNASGDLIYMNPAGRRLLGIPADIDISSKRMREYTPPWAIRLSQEESVPMATQAGVWVGEGAVLGADGREIPVAKVVIAHRGPDGEVQFFSSIASDLSDRKRMEEQLLRAQRLETAGRIAGQVAHDFNNLLAPLVGYPELIKMRLPAGHPAIAFCDAMAEAAQRLAEINEDLLALGRRGSFNQAPLDCNLLLGQLGGTLSEIPDTVSVTFDLAPDLMPIMGSSAQLLRVFANLVVNGREAMEDVGEITLTTENVYADRPLGSSTRVPIGEYVRVEVRDTGPGIPADIQGKIFDPFFSTKGAGRRRGAGLGLSVVQSIVEDHNGFVDHVSKPGVGTVFNLYFPVCRDAQGEEAPLGVPEGSESVLIVDDDQGQREVAKHLLASVGYQVAAVSSGEAAIAFLDQNSVDLIVLDMVMPIGMDGAETFEQVRALWPQQRAVVLSGFAESDRVEKALKLGAGAFLHKPISLAKLARAVRSELDRE